MCPAVGDDEVVGVEAQGDEVDYEDGYEPEVFDDDDDVDDGQGGYLSPTAADDLYLRDASRDVEEGGAEAEAPTRLWKIDPNFGQYHLKCTSRVPFSCYPVGGELTRLWAQGTSYSQKPGRRTLMA